MSSVYSGIVEGISNFKGGGATAVASGAGIAISNASNSYPIVIDTAPTPHGFNTGDRVVIAGVGGNTAANSPTNSAFQIDVLTPTTFTLSYPGGQSVNGNGAYTVGGFAWDVSLTPPFTLPSDTDTLDAASVNVALETLADRTQALARLLQPSVPLSGQLGAAQLIGVYAAPTPDDTWASWNAGNATNGAWAATASPDLLFLSASNISANHGDYFVVSFSAGEVIATATPIAFDVAMKFGCSSPDVSAFNPLDGAAVRFNGGDDKALIISATKPLQATGTTAAVLLNLGGNVFEISGLAGCNALLNGGGATLTLWNTNDPNNAGTFPIIPAGFVSTSRVKIYNPNGNTADANNGSIKWRIDRQPFDAQIWSYGIGAATAYDMRGHRTMIVSHYRPNYLFEPGGTP